MVQRGFFSVSCLNYFGKFLNNHGCHCVTLEVLAVSVIKFRSPFSAAGQVLHHVLQVPARMLRYIFPANVFVLSATEGREEDE